MLRGQCTIMFIQSESKIEISNGTHMCLEHERRLVEPGAVEPATSCISGSRHPPATMDDVSQQCTGKKSKERYNGHSLHFRTASFCNNTPLEPMLNPKSK